jgi:hypothetical protein
MRRLGLFLGLLAGLCLLAPTSALAWFPHGSAASVGITQTGIGSAQNASGGVPAAVTTTATCPAGSAILVMVTDNLNITASTNTLVDQTGSNTYTQVTSSPSFQTNNSLWGSLWIATNITALPSGDTVTFTTSTFSAIGMAVNCVTGLATSSPQDVGTTWAQSNFASTLSAPATGTLAHANELIVTTGSTATGSSAPVCGGSFATMGSYIPPGGAPTVYWCGLVVSATTSVTGSVSWTTNEGAQIAAFSFHQ